MGLKEALAAIPDVQLTETREVLHAIEDSARYLASDAALESLALDPYWPKWHSPWWHMLLLFELDESPRIPSRIVEAMVAALNNMPLHIFPIAASDVPPGLDIYRHSSCHCALGCMSRVLVACGVDVDRELPWIAPWFPRYQMADGGLNCESEAYLVRDECPSSMVATIAPFEALSLGPTNDFVDRAAKFLIERELRFGSATKHNAAERVAQTAWLAPCFPRFYFYDVLRGVSALVRWASAKERTLPSHAIADVLAHLITRFPDGVVRIERQAFAGAASRLIVGAEWTRVPNASTFPLLNATSAIGTASPTLTRQWAETRRTLLTSSLLTA